MARQDAAPLLDQAGVADVQAVQNGLHHNHSPVHNQSKIQSAQAHEVAADPKKIHHADGKEHGQGYDGRDQEASPQVAQKKDQNQDNNKSPFREVNPHGLDGTVHHFGSIQKGFHDHTLRETGLNGFDFLFDGLNNTT